GLYGHKQLLRDGLGRHLEGHSQRLVDSRALGAWVPRSFWQAFFLEGSPTLAAIWGPLVGPLVAILSFVCSIGNVPLAAILWNGGISFGGVMAFIFADLIVLPVLNIYRKY
ncbi:MAG TPA: permease, partial [Rubrobacter sp.]|nr:permease [Rubrobacter sp.]